MSLNFGCFLLSGVLLLFFMFGLPLFLIRCEAFSSYPRTYDLIHANGVFSLYKNR